MHFSGIVRENDNLLRYGKKTHTRILREILASVRYIQREIHTSLGETDTVEIMHNNFYLNN
jgi:hypothetical protein